ncbi:hypothetical protein LCGC14_0355220 [marine sediment metagenome]|uniref:Uncharacterized protein n=1 Tax=marine sediment metagenome TaxID=412755 RepID=A0A0F9TSM5_9ZZZZ
MTYYKSGDHSVICDRCGFKVKASETRKEWNGLRICKTHWEPRHPQEFIRGRPDHQAVYDPRPEGIDLFLDPNQVTSTDFTTTGKTDTTDSHAAWDGGLAIWDAAVSGGPSLWD